MKKIENNFVVTGFVGKDAEIRQFTNASVARFPRRKLLKSRPNQRKKARNNPCLITTKAAFGSLLFYSLRCCCTICTFILYLFSFTAFRNALAGLNAGIL